MNGQDLGNHIMGGIILLVVVSLLIGAVVGIGGWFGFSWVFSHVNIGIS